jgi:flagellar assembly protein FliH
MKPGHPGSLLRTAVVLDMGDVEAHAQRVLADAHDRAAAMLDEAERKAAHLTANADHIGHAQGHARGLAEGLESGRREGREQALQEGRAELTQLAQRWNDAIVDWEARRDRLFDEGREDVLRFAFAMGERIVHRMIRADPGIVRDQLIAALKHLSRPTALQVSVHPDDRAVIEAVLPEVASALGRGTHMHLHDDLSIDRGGCVVATAGGYVDASLATQLDRMAEALLRDGRLVERSPARNQGAGPSDEALRK